MAAKTKTQRPPRDTYAEITASVLAALDAGTIPWRKPWRADVDGPRSIDGRPYRGINTFMLLLEAQSKGYSDPRWLTFARAIKEGGHVRKGEHGTMVLFWKRTPIRKTDEETGLTTVKMIPLARAFTVFNVEQVDGLDLKAIATSARATSPIEAAEAIVEAMPNRPAIRWDGGDRAFYTPASDTIRVPSRDSFASDEEVYSTLFHEIGHSTGHPSRCARKESTSDWHAFGSESYGREELVAEMTSAFLCGEAGIVAATVANSAAYIANWRRAIHDDPRAVVIAAAQAQKAADYVLARFAEETEQAA